ncbi:DUF2691 family protein [Chengkuizengella marina]|uniref:DUF2691 family protein n=1 Tax=Chengkuizengella marina TaxID=2507566 RepID=A0A6N9PZ90_9BACL|nr:DUF2691 family protein [Chengkuizengella marina]NBI27935.1 DUF2691 family protein [Chengkuizengella marina]
MIRGISFEITNEYGVFIADILKTIDITKFNWQISSGEFYDQAGEELFSEEIKIIDGTVFKNQLENNSYYIVFANLKAYPKEKVISKIESYEEFINSECQLVLLITDSCYTTIYCKEKEELELLYQNVIDCGFKDVQYITDKNDSRTRLTVN